MNEPSVFSGPEMTVPRDLLVSISISENTVY